MTTETVLASSFRDPAGFVFRAQGRLVRFVAPEYVPTLTRLTDSGLYAELTEAKLLIRHEEIADPVGLDVSGARFLQPELVTTISYPYEWCFSQLKDAALAVLRIQARAIAKGLVLKDATAFNVQFHRGEAVLIDTLSFEEYREGMPWRAYRQFCEHFLAPLALMAYVDARLNQLLRVHIDGIPLELAAKMLPFRTKLSPGLAMHLHLHANAQSKSGTGRSGDGAFSKVSMLGLIDSLKRTIEKLAWAPKGTIWGDYYENTNYSGSAMVTKRDLVSELLRLVDPKPRVLWDLGANTGEFSKLASSAGIETVAWDFDVAAVEKSYKDRNGDERLLPLVVDLTNPSPSLGWASEERDSFAKRCNADVVMALALVHHLAIGNNVPLGKIAEFFAGLSPWLLIEFVPKSDSQVQRLLSTRDDIYVSYTDDGFQQAFRERFEILARRPITDTDRVLYLMRRVIAE
jgi:ribosomal protein L11 methylase PrmA